MEEYQRKEDFGKAFEELPSEEKKELNELGRELSRIQKENNDHNIPISEDKIKKRVAKVCLELINETPKDKISIMETSYIIAGSFIGFVYGDKLDEAVGIAGDLELPEAHVSGDIFKLWEKMKKIFEKYKNG